MPTTSPAQSLVYRYVLAKRRHSCDTCGKPINAGDHLWYDVLERAEMSEELMGFDWFWCDACQIARQPNPYEGGTMHTPTLPAWLDELKEARKDLADDPGCRELIEKYESLSAYRAPRLIRIAEVAAAYDTAHEAYKAHRYGGNGGCADCEILGVSKCLNGGKPLHDKIKPARLVLRAALRGDEAGT